MKTMQISLLMLLVLGCAAHSTIPAAPTVESLPAPGEVNSTEKAVRALVIAQQVRVAARDTLAARIKADGVISDEEMATARKFDEYDSQFTRIWSLADAAITRWQRGEVQAGADFALAYSSIVDSLTTPSGLRAVALGRE